MSLPCMAQQDELDRLEALIIKAPSDTNKVLLINQYVSQLREIDILKADKYALEAELLAKALHFKKGLGQTYENLSWLNYRKGEFSKAFEIATEGIRINKEINSKLGLSRCINTIAAINFEQQQYTLAIQNFKLGYVYAHEAKDISSASRSLNNIAFCFITQHNTDSARYYASIALQENEGSQEIYMAGFSKRILGDVYMEDGDIKKAIENYKECLAVASQVGNNSLLTSTLHRLGKAYNILNQPDRALAYLLRNITIAEKRGYRDELERSYKLASESYLIKNELIKAYEYQSKYVLLHDSIYNQKNSERVSLIQVQFDTEMKQAEIDLLTKDAELKRQEINRQQIWMLLGAGCLSLLLLLAFVLYYNNKRFKNVNAQLEKQNIEIQNQAQLLQNLNTTKDKLFSIISHDLRSPVARLKGLMEIFSRNGLSKDEFINLAVEVRQNIDFLYDDLDNLLQWAQSQLKGLQASPTEFNLRAVIAEKIELFKSLATGKNVEILNEVDEGINLFADRNHISLVLRNLLANAIKFSSEGDVIRVSVKEVSDNIEVSVTDEGVGMSNEDILKLFNAETHFTKPGTKKEKGVGIGLIITKEFIESNGGSIWVTSELGKGSTFTFSVKGKQEAVMA